MAKEIRINKREEYTTNKKKVASKLNNNRINNMKRYDNHDWEQKKEPSKD